MPIAKSLIIALISLSIPLVSMGFTQLNSIHVTALKTAPILVDGVEVKLIKPLVQTESPFFQITKNKKVTRIENIYGFIQIFSNSIYYEGQRSSPGVIYKLDIQTNKTVIVPFNCPRFLFSYDEKLVFCKKNRNLLDAITGNLILLAPNVSVRTNKNEIWNSTDEDGFDEAYWSSDRKYLWFRYRLEASADPLFGRLSLESKKITYFPSEFMKIENSFEPDLGWKATSDSILCIDSVDKKCNRARLAKEITIKIHDLIKNRFVSINTSMKIESHLQWSREGLSIGREKKLFKTYAQIEELLQNSKELPPKDVTLIEELKE